jgi:hypothetical protein
MSPAVATHPAPTRRAAAAAVGPLVGEAAHLARRDARHRRISVQDLTVSESSKVRRCRLTSRSLFSYRTRVRARSASDALTGGARQASVPRALGYCARDLSPVLTHRQTRPFVWIAWLGVVTTALNTLIPLASRATTRDLDALRDVVLLVHAPATLLPLIALSLLAFRRGPFAAVAVVAFTAMEKFVEFIGQALQLFPPEETLGGVRVQALVESVWNQMYFVLWLCNTLGATGAGLLMFRLARPPLKFLAASAAWSAALFTLLMLLGNEYVGLSLPQPTATLFFIVFTGYRLALAFTLARSIAPASPDAEQRE